MQETTVNPLLVTTARKAKILNPYVFPFRFASAGTSVVMETVSELYAITKFWLWCNAANTWRLEKQTMGNVIPILPPAGFAFDYLANQGSLDVAEFVENSEGLAIIPVITVEPGEQLQLVRGGVGEILGAIWALPIKR